MNAVIDITGVILETERLIIRPWEEKDLQDLFDYARVDGVGQMAGWPPHKSPDETKRILDMFIREKKCFALELKENGKVIGSLGIEKLSHPYYEDRQGREIGYVLSKDYWGNGLMPEAVKRVIKYCFEETECSYLMCSCAPFNTQSRRVIEKSGFTFLFEKVRTLSDGSQRSALYHILEK